MKIQSVSDIITNSSSEVFMMVDTDNVQRIRDLIENLLISFNVNESLDDIMTITPVVSEYYIDDLKTLILTGHLNYTEYEKFSDRIEEGYPLCEKEEDITDDMMLKAAIYYNENSSQYEYREGYPVVRRIELVAKNIKYNGIVDAINEMINNCPYEVWYC